MADGNPFEGSSTPRQDAVLLESVLRSTGLESVPDEAIATVLANLDKLIAERGSQRGMERLLKLRLAIYSAKTKRAELVLKVALAQQGLEGTSGPSIPRINFVERDVAAHAAAAASGDNGDGQNEEQDNGGSSTER